MARVKLYELLASLIQMNETLINAEISKSKILNYILVDYSTHDDNTNILILLNGVVKSIIQT